VPIYRPTVESTDQGTLRRVRAGDWRALRRCRLRALTLDADSFGTSLEEAAARPEDHWRQLARSHSDGGDRAILVVVRDGAVLGMIRIEREQPDGLFGIYSLWVSPELRRRGLAARLLAEAERWAISVGARRAELFVAPDASPARALYERFGYRPNGRTDDDRDDGVAEIGMEKPLLP
jgi:ribosomal protein S18 acetylase RimI-like enzyme